MKTMRLKDEEFDLIVGILGKLMINGELKVDQDARLHISGLIRNIATNVKED